MLRTAFSKPPLHALAVFGMLAAQACHSTLAQTREVPAPIASDGTSFLAMPSEPPPDTPKAVWDSLIAPSNVVNDSPAYPGRIVRDALYVRFAPNAEPAARLATLSRVSGRVVGGKRIAGNDGYYLVRVRVDSTKPTTSDSTLLRARRQLDHDPTVRGTLLLIMDDPPR
jgi:hypothetical protein